MATDEVFDLFHRYNRLVRRELVRPLSCPVCENNLITTLGDDDELVLWCAICDTTTVPGQATLEKVEAVVKEHFVE